MKRGDIVQVYQDPLTREMPEGSAMLLKHLGDDAGCQIWKVRFVEDHPHQVCIRRILAD